MAVIIINIKLLRYWIRAWCNVAVVFSVRESMQTRKSFITELSSFHSFTPNILSLSETTITILFRHV